MNRRESPLFLMVPGPGSILSSRKDSVDRDRIVALILGLRTSRDREHALAELNRLKEHVDNMGVLLWHSFGSMTVLLQEIVSVYPFLTHSSLTPNICTRICHALDLMQCVASHSQTQSRFLQAQLPIYLYPILNTTSRSTPFEYLRLASLGIIAALVRNNSRPAIEFLITTEIIPLCLRIMETGNEQCKTMAIFIIQNTLLDDTGLEYICNAYERFYAVITVLNNMLLHLNVSPSPRIYKHVLRCYLQFSEHPKTRMFLKQHLRKEDLTLPLDDQEARKWHARLLENLSKEQTLDI